MEKHVRYDYLNRNILISLPNCWKKIILIIDWLPWYAAEEKEPYEAKARADKKRYNNQIGDYKNPQSANLDSENESDSN